MKSGGVRITVDYRKLNLLCAPSLLPIPRADDTIDKLLNIRTREVAVGTRTIISCRREFLSIYSTMLEGRY